MKRKALLVILGLVSVLMAVQLVLVLAHRKTQAELLVEVLTSSDAADAAWAFERLLELDFASLEDLLPHLRNEETSALRAMSWSDRGSSGFTSSTKDYAVWQVVRFVLWRRLSSEFGRDLHSLSDIHDSSPVLVGQYRAAFREALMTHADQARPFWRKWLDPVRVTPPSGDPRTASLAGEGVLTFLKCADRCGAAWAVARLKTLPDEELRKLLPLASSPDPIPLVQFFWGSQGGGSGQGQLSLDGTVGKLVRCLIAERVGAIGSVDNADLTSAEAPPALLEKLSQDLNARLAQARPATRTQN